MANTIKLILVIENGEVKLRCANHTNTDLRLIVMDKNAPEYRQMTNEEFNKAVLQASEYTTILYGSEHR